MLIINQTGVKGDCVLVSAAAVGCWEVVLRISAYRNQRKHRTNNNTKKATKTKPPLRHAKKQPQNSPKTNERRCKRPLLFQQQPMDLAEPSVLASAVSEHCSWLHLKSASRYK